MNYSIQTDEKTNITTITLVNGGLTASFLDFGARWHQFLAPDKNGKLENILLSLDTLEEVLVDQAQFGALVGPVAGRIKNAEWKGISLDKNLGDLHHIHGGSKGWWCQFWNYEIIEEKEAIKVVFSLTDTLSGYPGPIHVTNTYELTQTGVTMTTCVTSNEVTIVNPTNHVYFNLSGDAKRKISDHLLTIKSPHILETGNLNIPTGKLISVENTGYDFNTPRVIKEAIKELKTGIDDAYLLENTSPQIILADSISGRQLTIDSNRQSVVVFSTTGFNDSFKVNGQSMSSEIGIALETQELPDITHYPEWGNIEIIPNETKTYQTTYTISSP
ncbi:aldose epimerase family protein [Vagococcus fluvialis]|uniref:aldose epimerase family protein n=1 Tax=Vagococcus fluvialis TaxID=2738 RepID=UPI001D0BC2E7|nr:aldose epimerase family protein [Vagococcus fluvialis]MDT2781631.1 galactose mutarotase [Vagococcus fluvialis]UDM71498.1 galactose mutarotase [Vagococcus fluvialis]UDM74728.1 galactose mutarotase [Vagococcus fluvialis]UDM76359.1 galactose mutarotase [Vagococcus fluvialis]UDM83190.1 galactose mutarotase [Vagococcus fluvialis]